MSPTSRGSLWLATAAIALAQFAYWFGLTPLLFSYPPIRNLLPVDGVSVATLDRPELASLDRATLRRIDFGEHQCCGPGYRAVVFDLMLDTVPPDGLAYANTLGADNVEVYVNGSLVRGDGRMTLPDITYHNNIRAIVRIPSGLLNVGRNEIASIVVRDYVPWFDIFRPVVGPYSALRADLARRGFLLVEYKLISATIGVVLAVLALLVCLRREQRRLGIWMMLLLTAWTLRTLYYTWAESPLHGVDRLSYYFLLTVALPLAWINVVNEWTDRPWRWLPRAALGLFAATLIGIELALRTDALSGYDTAALLTNVFGITCAVGGVCRLLQHFWQHAEDRPWERAVLLLCVTLISVEFAQELLFNATNGQMQTSLPLLMVVFASAFARGNARLLGLANQFNALLSGRLAQREAELSDSHRREKELLQRETLTAERKRLMLDMHDGVVGQLAALQHLARRGDSSAAELADGIAGVADELRLVIDSLDSVGTNLSSAIANYRSRMESRLTALGIESYWRNDLPIDAAPYQPETVLQVLRILQETISNAIKYAHTRRLDVTCEMGSEPARTVRLIVRDYGAGVDSEAVAGRGLGNMRTRAEAIGARVRLDPERPGTSLVLELPLG